MVVVESDVVAVVVVVSKCNSCRGSGTIRQRSGSEWLL